MPVETEYYETLEIAYNADDREIRRAYKRLALKYHPDRNHGDTNAAGQFKRIGEAYEVLNDPESRRIYDVHGKGGLHSHGQDEAGFDFHSAEDIFSMFFGDESFTRRGKRERKPSEIVHEVRMTLEELYCGATKRVSISRNRICSDCSGCGLRTPEVLRHCRTCDGSGRVDVIERDRGFMHRNQLICHGCDGLGRIVTKNDICTTCRGEATVRHKHTQSIEIYRGMHEDGHIRLTGEGHQVPGCELTGDVVIVFALQPHDVFTRKGDMLITSKRISLLHALSARPISMTHLDGRKLRLATASNSTIDPNFVWCVVGEGMPIESTGGVKKGNLLVHMSVQMPEKSISPSLLLSDPILKKELTTEKRHVRGLSSTSGQNSFLRSDPTLEKVLTSRYTKKCTRGV